MSLLSVLQWTVLLATAAASFTTLAAIKSSYDVAREARLDRLMPQPYIMDLSLDPESLRGKGLFTDFEIEAFKAWQEQQRKTNSDNPGP
jgi:hypothetical protein